MAGLDFPYVAVRRVSERIEARPEFINVAGGDEPSTVYPLDESYTVASGDYEPIRVFSGADDLARIITERAAQKADKPIGVIAPHQDAAEAIQVVVFRVMGPLERELLVIIEDDA
jgi:hypothetical protein